MRTINMMAWLSGVMIISAFQTVYGNDTATNELAATCPQCEMTWINKSDQIGKFSVFQTGTVLECVECKSDVLKYFNSRNFVRSCKSCEDFSVCIIRQINVTPMPPLPMELVNSAMGPKCKAIWVKEAGGDGVFTVYSSEATEVCVECQDLAVTMIYNGQFNERCTGCSNELMVRNPSTISTEMAFSP